MPRCATSTPDHHTAHGHNIGLYLAKFDTIPSTIAQAKALPQQTRSPSTLLNLGAITGTTAITTLFPSNAVLSIYFDAYTQDSLYQANTIRVPEFSERDGLWHQYGTRH